METLAMHHRRGQQTRVGNRLRPQHKRPTSAFGPACRRQLVGPRPGRRTVGSGGEEIFLRACGDLTDWRALRGFQSQCEALLHSGIDRVVLDLSEVRQADTKLVACLLVLLRRARNVNVQFEVRCSRTVNQWVAVCHLQTAVLGPTTAGHRRFRSNASDWNLDFRREAFRSCSESSAGEPGVGQMGDVGRTVSPERASATTTLGLFAGRSALG